jgi:hypothetical protein
MQEKIRNIREFLISYFSHPLWYYPNLETPISKTGESLWSVTIEWISTGSIIPALKARRSTAHGASPGLEREDKKALEGRNRLLCRPSRAQLETHS